MEQDKNLEGVAKIDSYVQLRELTETHFSKRKKVLVKITNGNSVNDKKLAELLKNPVTASVSYTDWPGCDRRSQMYYFFDTDTKPPYEIRTSSPGIKEGVLDLNYPDEYKILDKK